MLQKNAIQGKKSCPCGSRKVFPQIWKNVDLQ